MMNLEVFFLCYPKDIQIVESLHWYQSFKFRFTVQVYILSSTCTFALAIVRNSNLSITGI